MWWIASWVAWIVLGVVGLGISVVGGVGLWGMMVLRPKINKRDSEPSTYTLPSGRSLSFRVCGCTDGYTSTVVYFSGLLGSRHEASKDVVGKVRVIAVDRPGIGRSSPSYRRTYVQFADDVHKLMTVGMGVSKYGVVGFSSGGPYALACAAMHSESVTVVGLLCADTEWATTPWSNFNNLHRFIYVVQYLFPFTVHPLVYLASGLAIATSTWSGRSAPATNVAEAVRQGPAGAAREVFIERRYWGFELEMVRQRVYLVHSNKDEMVPVGAAKRSEARLPNVDCTYLPRGSHNGVLRKQWADTITKMATHL